MVAAACQVPGNAKCMTKEGVVTGDPCCEGSSCEQWFDRTGEFGRTGKGGHYYCQYKDCIPSGGSCNVS